MDRDNFLGLIQRALDDGTISPAEYQDLLDAYDAGELPLDGPRPPAEEIRRPGAATFILIAIWLLATLSPGQDRPGGRSATPQTIRSALAASTRAGRLALAERIQDQFEEEIADLTQRLAAGRINLATWQQAAGDLIDRNLIAQTMAGSRSAALTTAQIGRLGTLIEQERAFLSRFADTIATRQALGRPLSAGAMIHRARSYAGTGRGEYFRAEEEAATQAGEEGEGIVIDYVSNDDDRTCGPCLDADGGSPYLPGQGPYPGQICLGGGACRCSRIPRYDPEAWAWLMGYA